MGSKRRPRLSPAEAEAMMIPKIVEAIYPVLIPIEQQDCDIQKRHLAMVTHLARNAWRDFVGWSDPPSQSPSVEHVTSTETEPK